MTIISSNSIYIILIIDFFSVQDTLEDDDAEDLSETVTLIESVFVTSLESVV